MQTLLVLCTGNYYRSRYAEILFNHLAREQSLAWQAVSRGLAPDPFNPGPMSRSTIGRLREKGIAPDSYMRLPLAVTAADFEAAQHIVAVKEREHRAMIERDFPTWTARVEFWHVDDLDCVGPEIALPHLDREVVALMERLGRKNS